MNQALVIWDDEKSSGTYFGFPVFFTSDAVGGEKLCAINKGGKRVLCRQRFTQIVVGYPAYHRKLPNQFLVVKKAIVGKVGR